MADQIITPTDFKDYANNFGLIADSGAESYKALGTSVSLIDKIDESSFMLTNLGDPQTQIKFKFKSDIKSAMNAIKDQALNLSVVQSSFMGLSAHIKKWTGQDINTYLESNRITINRLYGAIASFFGENISESNTEKV